MTVRHSPPAQDVRAVIDFVRRRGSAQYLPGEVPEDFAAWRLALRRRARAEGIRVSVRRLGPLVFIEFPDWEPGDDEMAALAETVAGIAGDHPVDYETALANARRRRLRVVK